MSKVEAGWCITLHLHSHFTDLVHRYFHFTALYCIVLFRPLLWLSLSIAYLNMVVNPETLQCSSVKNT